MVVFLGGGFMGFGFRRFSYICGFLAPIVAYVLIFAAIMSAPWFNWFHNALSDLGGWLGVESGSAPIFNSGLIISGVVLPLSGVFLFLIGVFPETAGRIHYYVSVGFFVTFPIGMLIISIFYLYSREDLVLGIYGLVVFIASIIIWGVIPWKALGATNVAIPEFTSSFIGSIWVWIFTIKKLFIEK